jgi:hypothetical protein
VEKGKGAKIKPPKAGRSKKKMATKPAPLCGSSKKEGRKNKTVHDKI